MEIRRAKKSSPLHQFFTWDVKKAAAAYWIEEARSLITAVQITITTETTNIVSVAYVRDPSVKPNQQGYIAVETLRTDEEMARAALVNEFSRVADMLRRAREIAVALNAQGDVEALLQSVVGLRQRFMEQPTQQQ